MGAAHAESGFVLSPTLEWQIIQTLHRTGDKVHPVFGSQMTDLRSWHAFSRLLRNIPPGPASYRSTRFVSQSALPVECTAVVGGDIVLCTSSRYGRSCGALVNSTGVVDRNCAPCHCVVRATYAVVSISRKYDRLHLKTYSGHTRLCDPVYKPIEYQVLNTHVVNVNMPPQEPIC